MSYLIHCAVAVTPCPPESQAAVESLSIQLLADMGVTAGSVGLVMTYGFGFVLACGLIGYVVAVGVRVINQL